MTTKVVVHSVGLEKARRWKNDSGEGASAMTAMAARKAEDAKRRRTATAQAIYDGQEARGNHVGVFFAPA